MVDRKERMLIRKRALYTFNLPIVNGKALYKALLIDAQMLLSFSKKSLNITLRIFRQNKSVYFKRVGRRRQTSFCTQAVDDRIKS